MNNISNLLDKKLINIYGIAWSDDGTKICRTSNEFTIYIDYIDFDNDSMNITTENTNFKFMIKKFDIYDLIDKNTTLLSPVWSSDNMTIVCGSMLGYIFIYNINKKEFKLLIGHIKKVYDIHFIDEKLIISCGYDKTIRVWNINNDLHNYNVKKYTKPLYVRALDIDDNYVAYVQKNSVYLSHLNELSNKNNNEEMIFKYNIKISKVRFSPNHKLLACLATDGIITLISIDNRKIIGSLKTELINTKSLSFNRLATSIIVSNINGHINLLDIRNSSLSIRENSKVEYKLTGHTKKTRVSWNHNPKYEVFFASTSNDGTSRIWNYDIIKQKYKIRTSIIKLDNKICKSMKNKFEEIEIRSIADTLNIDHLNKKTRTVCEMIIGNLSHMKKEKINKLLHVNEFDETFEDDAFELLDILMKKDIKDIKYKMSGSMVIEIIIIFYLMSKHSKECFPIATKSKSISVLKPIYPVDPDKKWYEKWYEYILSSNVYNERYNKRLRIYFDQIYKLNSKYSINIIYKSDYNDITNDVNNKLINIEVSNKLINDIKKCLKNKNTNFIVIYLTLAEEYFDKDNILSSQGHANILIFDVKRNEVERFEPHGQVYNDWIDKILIDYFIQKNIIKDKSQYIKPLDYCPVMGFQNIDAFVEYHEHAIGDPGGFCSMWSFWYADLRLSNPNKTREEVVRKSMLLIKKKSQSFKNFIRSYAIFMNNIIKDINYSCYNYNTGNINIDCINDVIKKYL